jgi:hemoglobin
MAWTPTEDDSPYHRIGTEEAVRAIANHFYDIMECDEPELARLHEQSPEGGVSQGARDRFALFLIEWLGGPRGYSPVHGHPRLRMRHAEVPVTSAMRDAWLRCMARALAERDVPEEVRTFLALRFGEVAENLRNIKD